MSEFDETLRHADADTELIWNDVSDRLEAFLAAWESGSPPELGEFLSDEGAASRPFTLVELVKVDLEQRWTTDNSKKSLRDYASEFPELIGQDGIPIDLVYEEIHIRQRQGDALDLEAHLRQYPRQAEEVRRMLQLDNPQSQTTSLLGYAPKLSFGPGDTVDDFALISSLGQGAFASVFLARQVSMQRLVALKISTDRGREGQTLARLDHPNIVRVYDQRLLQDDGLRLMYMQYVPGGTLQELLRAMKEAAPREKWSGKLMVKLIDNKLKEQGVPLPADSLNRRMLRSQRWEDTVCSIGRHLAEALQAAHSEGVLHRDIKPANILFSESAIPKMVDFNISSCSKVEGASAAAYFGGSLAYMSPEQMEACNPRSERTAEDLAPTSDVYSLGIVLWELLTGSRPFAEKQLDKGWTATLDNLIQQRHEGVPEEAWHALRKSAPDGLIRVLRRCLAVNPAERFQSAAQLADQLLICLHPHAERLLSPPTGKIHQFMGRHPFIAMMLIVIIPNAFAAGFNYRFNYQTLIVPLQNAAPMFHRVMAVINGVAFPLGILFIYLVCGNEIKEVRKRFLEEPEEAAPRPLRHRCLRLGRYAALIGMALWAVAGVVYPVSMRLAGHPLQSGDFLFFFLSLLAGGAVGATYPYFGVTAMTTEVWYPALVRPRSVSTTDIHMFKWVERISVRYLIVAAVVPLLSMGVLVLRGDENRRIMMALSLGGVVILGIVFQLWRRLHTDFNALTDLAKAKTPVEIQLESLDSDSHTFHF